MLWIFSIKQSTFSILSPCYKSFSTLAILIFWDGLFFVVRSCLLYFRIFSSITGFFLLYDSSTSWVGELKMYPDIAKYLLREGRTYSTVFKNHWYVGLQERPNICYFFMYSQKFYLDTIKQTRKCIALAQNTEMLM